MVLGPLLFLVMLVPFTVNGLGVREAFFVSFLGNLGVHRRRGVRVRLPVLHHDDPARAARACPVLWENVFVRRTAVPGAQCADVTVVVVTWNALPWLEQCLDSCAATSVRRRPRLDRRNGRSSCASGFPTCG